MALTINQTEINSAIRYCNAPSDWEVVVVSKPHGKVQLWLYFLASKEETAKLYDDCSACVDITPSNGANDETRQIKWHSLEDTNPDDVPDDEFYFCRYLIGEDFPQVE